MGMVRGWGWSGDEETLPLLTAEVAEGKTREPERVLTGPWELKSLNPFETDMWSPLREPLFSQEKFSPKSFEVNVQLPELINRDKLFDSKMTHGLFGDREAP